MSDTDIKQVIAYQGEMMLAGWTESHNGGRKVTFWLPDDTPEHPFKAFTAKAGKVAGQRFAVVFVQIDDNEQPVIQQHAPAEAQPAPATKPYGNYAAILHKEGFFYIRPVLKAIGNDEEYLAWLRTRKCCVRESGYCHGDIVAAHVRRVANGSGAGIKPPFSAVPMCDGHHQVQHQKGESAFGGKDFFDNKLGYYLDLWASRKLANDLGYESMGYVPPETVKAWALENDLMQYLPGVYKA